MALSIIVHFIFFGFVYENIHKKLTHLKIINKMIFFLIQTELHIESLDLPIWPRVVSKHCVVVTRFGFNLLILLKLVIVLVNLKIWSFYKLIVGELLLVLVYKKKKTTTGLCLSWDNCGCESCFCVCYGILWFDFNSFTIIKFLPLTWLK